MWGVVLMSVTLWDGTTAIYGDVNRDTYVGWEPLEVCMRQAQEFNREKFWHPIDAYPWRHFACIQKPNESPDHDQ